jgi:hypothetical protein
MKKYIIGAVLAIALTTPYIAQAVNSHSVGVNVVDNQGTVYRIDASATSGGEEGKFKKPYTSAGAFLSYKYNAWKNIQAANSADMAIPTSTNPDGSIQYIAPRQGSLINDKGTVYLVTNRARRGFTSEAVFKEMGYSYKNVYPADTSFLSIESTVDTSSAQHPAGTLVNDRGTLYIMHYGGRVGVSSMAALDSWGYWASEAVIANSYDMALNEVAVANIRSIAEFDFFYTFQ